MGKPKKFKPKCVFCTLLGTNIFLFHTKACLVVDDFPFPQGGICCFWRVYSSLYFIVSSVFFVTRDDHAEVIMR